MSTINELIAQLQRELAVAKTESDATRIKGRIADLRQQPETRTT